LGEGENKMDEKQKILTELEEIFTRWQELLASLSAEQINQPLIPSLWTVKDMVAHLWSWQQATVARAEAALHGTAPAYPEWWQINGPDPNEDVDRTNAWIFTASKDRPWDRVYADWENQFARYLELYAQIPEKDLLEVGRYAWMGNHPLMTSTMGTLDHHQEHYESLKDWLQAKGK
jgi:hypothetical protein